MQAINEYVPTEQLLRNGNSGKTNYYEYCTGNEYWGCAYFVTIEKIHAANANEAIILLLLRMVSEQEGWDEKMSAAISSDEFITFIFSSGYLATGTGIDYPIASFRKNFNKVITGISDYENNRDFAPAISVKEKQILSVKCFADEWKHHQYLIETEKEWTFFDWGTTV